MPDFTGLFDNYGRRARLYPGLLTILPSVTMLVACAPSLAQGQSVAALVGAASTFGLLYALSSISRTAGKRTEKRLLRRWGGWPTTIMLRHSSTNIPVATKARYHQFLSQSGAWQQVPSAELEEGDPDNTDQSYASAVQWLKEQRRGPAFKILHHENAEYGFRRNMRGLKPAAISMGLLTVAAWWVAAFAHYGRPPWRMASSEVSGLLAGPSALAWAALALALVAVIGWIVVVRDAWVREAADQYATALLATCDAPLASKD